MQIDIVPQVWVCPQCGEKTMIGIAIGTPTCPKHNVLLKIEA